METKANADERREAGALLAQARTLRVKLVPPKPPTRLLRRDELEHRLDEAAAGRLTAVVAAAGFGKSTHLAERALANGWSWYTIDAADGGAPSVLAQGLGDALRRSVTDLEDAVVPQATSVDERTVADSLAAGLSRALEDRLADDVVLVVDDVHELGRDAPAVRVLEGLVRYAPAELHLVLSSRDEIPFSIARLRAQGNVRDFDGSDFAFSPDDVAAALAGAVGPDDAELASPLHEVTAGWPVAVQLAIEMLASIPVTERARALNELATRRGPLFAYLAEEIFARESSSVRDLLKVVVQFDRVTPALCDALGLTDAEEVLASLARRGLLIETEETYTAHALVRQFVATTWPLAPSKIRELRRRAGGWFEEEGDAVAATRAFTAAGDHQSIVRVWRDSWAQLDNAAAVETILEAATVLPQSEREAWGSLIAHGLIIRGDVDQAREWLAPLRSERTPHVLFLEGLAHMHRCEHGEALQKLMLARRTYPEQIDPYCSAFAGYQLIALGRVEEARPLLEEALALVSKQNPGGAAEAQLLASDLACADGDLTAAITSAEGSAARYAELENILGECSARNRLAVRLALLGRDDEAVEASAAATRLSEQIGFSWFQAWTANTRGLVRLASGRLDEAAADFTTSVAAGERLRSNTVAEALIGLGDVHRERGERTLARSVYERALLVAERSGCAAVQALGSAGLARLLADDEPTKAATLAETAVRLAPGLPEQIETLLARGWVSVCVGDVENAADAAAGAEARARRTGSPALLAQALELSAFATEAGAAQADVLQEALTIRRRLMNPLATAITTVALGSLEPGTVGSDELARAEQTLRELGVQRNRAAAGLLAMAPPRLTVPLAVETLGRFTVLRDGVPVTPAEWQSKKARDLLKILVTRRGQATPRDYLIELLWPDDDPSRTSKRLAVALNVLRNVLDPGRRHGSDHFIIGGPEGLRLELAHLAVDVEAFLRLGNEALAARAQGLEEGIGLLEAAEAAYAGEFLPEDRYEDWAAPLRDEAQAMYLEVVRLLAAEASDHAAAVRYLLRVLALDPFDEEAHVRLIASFARAGMHGEARRAYRRYVGRMDEIGLEPTAYEQAAAPH